MRVTDCLPHLATWVAVRRLCSTVLAGSLFSVGTAMAALNACDLNNDNAVNSADKDVAVAMTIGQQACTANITGPGVCTVATVQRVVNAALSGTCVTDSHSVTLNWVASTSANVAGYNVYRSSTSGGPYSKLNSALITTTNYIDTTVLGGQTYYYVARAVDSASTESANSNQAQAVVPSP